uniref:Nudix hydrolase 14 n=1 Tax=Equus caballus TaxID=9796 RepID=A0A9L0STN1_HORSE
MERIEGAAVGRCAASPYLRPLTLHYRQNGTQKSWDFMKTHDSVTILLFNSSRRSLVLVKQFRPAVYAGEVERRFPGSLTAVDQDGPRELQAALPGSAGVTFELCAGLLDQPGLSLEEVACKEAWEECGYRLAPSDLRRVATYKIQRLMAVCLRTPLPGWLLDGTMVSSLRPLAGSDCVGPSQRDGLLCLQGRWDSVSLPSSVSDL